MTSLSRPHRISPGNQDGSESISTLYQIYSWPSDRRRDTLNASESLYGRRNPISLFLSSQSQAASSAAPPSSVTPPPQRPDPSAYSLLHTYKLENILATY